MKPPVRSPLRRSRPCPACGRSLQRRPAVRIHGHRFHRDCALYRSQDRPTAA